MRHFTVLGFTTTANSEQGELIHLGSDRGEAIGVTNTPDERFVRKQLYELAVPHKTRHFNFADGAPEHQLTDEQLAEEQLPDDQVDDQQAGELAAVIDEAATEDPGEPEGTQTPELSKGAKTLADEHQLTDEQLAEIVPSGASGKIVKEDVEVFLKQLEANGN